MEDRRELERNEDEALSSPAAPLRRQAGDRSYVPVLRNDRPGHGNLAPVSAGPGQEVQASRRPGGAAREPATAAPAPPTATAFLLRFSG